MMHFTKHDQLPTQTQIENQMNTILRAANLEFKIFLKNTERIQDSIIKVEDQIEGDLKMMEDGLIESIHDSYELIENMVSELYDKINKDFNMKYVNQNEMNRAM